VAHHFPDLFGQLASINDPRQKRNYSIKEIVFAGIAMFVFKCGSRLALDNLKAEEQFRSNYFKAFGLRLPDMDTVALVFENLEEKELHRIKKHLVNQLIKRKVLDRYRLNGMLLVAVDGTGLVSFHSRHCDECLTKTSKNGVTTYFHNVLEAKIVTSNGFSFSILTEWIANPGTDYHKQDCETKAYYRLARKLKQEYPRLPVCICADGLYPNSTFFDICRDYRWGYIVVLKDDRHARLWGKIASMKHESLKKTIVDKVTGEVTKQRYWFSNNISHNGHTHNWIELDEQVEKNNGREKMPFRFVFLTNQHLSSYNVETICHAGRTRWKIEKQGFDQQKNHGYNISHKYSRNSFAGMKNFYQCCQIGHLLNQLVELSVSFRKLLTQKRTIKFLWQCMMAQLLIMDISHEAIHQPPQQRFISQFIE